MADRILFIGFAEPVRGREERAVESFNEAMGYFGRKQQENGVESFDVALLQPNRDLGGFIAVHGTAAQLAAVHEDEEFQRLITSATTLVEGMRVIDGYMNEGVAGQMAIYQEAIAGVPQMA